MSHNQTHDAYGKEWAKLNDICQDMVVRLDNGFTCHNAGPCLIHQNHTGLFFYCEEGKHYLSGQADDGIHCVGIYPGEVAQ